MNYETLDPGIREVVRWLHSLGYKTTDSGDGYSKLPDERAMNVAHVAIDVSDAERHENNLVWLANYLVYAHCHQHGLPKAVVEASYSTLDDKSLLMLFPFGMEQAVKPCG